MTVSPDQIIIIIVYYHTIIYRKKEFPFVCFKSFQSLKVTLSGSFQFSSPHIARCRRSPWVWKLSEPGSRATDRAMRVWQPRFCAQGRWLCQPSQNSRSRVKIEKNREPTDGRLLAVYWPSTDRMRQCYSNYTNNGVFCCLKI